MKIYKILNGVLVSPINAGRLILVFICFLFFSVDILFADEWNNYELYSTEGTEFYTTFLPNAGSAGTDNDLNITLFASTRSTSQVTIKVESFKTGEIETYTVSANSVTSITIPSSDAYIENSEGDTVLTKSLKITTTGGSISLYSSNLGSSSFDGSFILPSSSLGKEYIVQTYSSDRFATEFAIIATKDATSIDIIYTTNIANTGQSSASSISLDEGEVYMVRSLKGEYDLSGTIICSDKDVAVINGNQSARVPYDFSLTDDHIYEQALTTNMWGTNFAIVNAYGYKENRIRITPLYDNTEVYVNNVLYSTISSRDSTLEIAHQEDTNISSFITTSKPVVCYQYLTSAGYNKDFEGGISYGDPSMFLIPPIEQAISELSFATFSATSSLDHYVNITVPQSGVSSMKLDNKDISSYFASLTGNSNYAYARISIDDGAHTLSNSISSFLSYVYGGSTSAESYAYTTGFNTIPLSAYIEVNAIRDSVYTVCQNETSNIDAIISSEYKLLEWYLNDSLISSSYTFNYQFLDEGTFDLSLLVYRYTLCDVSSSIIDTITTTVVVNPVYNRTITANICKGDVYVYEGEVIDTSLDEYEVGKLYEFYQYETSVSKCDSTIVHYLTIRSNDNIEVYDSICDNEVYLFHEGKSYEREISYDVSEITTYTIVDSLLNIYDCDSIVTLYLTVMPSYLIESDTTICEGDILSWRGQVFKDSIAGLYAIYDSYQTVTYGCDSIYKLNVTINPVYEIEEYISICEIDSYTWLGHKGDTVIGNLSAGGGGVSQEYIFRDSLQTVGGLGCDSVHILYLTVHSIDNVTVSDSICDNEVYLFHEGELYERELSYNVSEVTTYTIIDTLINSIGCDSVVTLHLTVAPSYLIEQDTIICEGDILNWRGKIFQDSIAGTYEIFDNYQTVIYGCDSIYRLNVVINPSYEIEEYISICEIDSYTWLGHKGDTIISNLTAGDNKTPKDYIYVDSLLTVGGLGCDSVHILHLTVNPIQSVEVYDTLCDNEIYLFHEGELYERELSYNISEVTTYTIIDTLINSHGCDSIVTLYLTVAPSYLIEQDTIICAGDILYWRGKIFQDSVAGIYEIFDNYQTVAYGCDSIYKLNVAVNPIYEIEEYITICENESYTWLGHKSDTIISNLTAGDNRTPKDYIYVDSLLTVGGLGCDSVHILHLTVSPINEVEVYDTLCDNEIYLFHEGESYERELSFDVSVATAYTIVDTLINTHGCDSIVTLFLTVAPSYLIEQDTIICEGDILNWRGKIFQDLAAGTCEIYDNYQTVTYGCDSVYKLNVVVHPSYEIEEYVYMCEGDSYTWIGHKGDTIIGNLSIGDGNLSQEYIFIDSLQTTVGCDSIHILHLSVNPTYYVFAETSICDNESYNFNGRILSDVAGVYTVFDTLQTIYGCDSVVELTLTVHPTYLFDTTAVICSNEIITYRGIDYRTEGVYDDSLHTIYGCDSIYRLNLIVIPAYEFEYNITICDTESFYWRNQNLNTFKGEFPTGLNIISQKYYTDAGCDSVYKLNLTINPTYFFEDSITICSNETYDFRGKILTQEGVYYDSLLTTLGCDSVYQFTLYHNPAYSFVIYDTICSNETYDFRGVIVNQEGVYYDSLTTVLDCDSVYELRLTVMPTYFFDLEEHICDYETYNFNGLELAEEGFYIDSLYSIYGCDSVYHLNLFVHPSTVDTIYDTICVEGKYYFGDRYLTEPGYYLDTTLNEFNCRHIDHLFLSQIEPAKITFEVDDFCADDLFFELRFSYDGYAPVSYSIKYDDIGKDVGFEDNIDILLEDTVIQIPIPQFSDKTDYVRPNVYDLSLYFHNGYCSDEQVKETYQVTAFYPSWIIEQHWNDAIAVLNDSLNGGYLFSHYQWYREGIKIGVDSSYYYAGEYSELVMGDAYYVGLTRIDDGKTFYSCPIFPSEVVDWDVPTPFIEVLPTYVSKTSPYVFLTSVTSGYYDVRNALGLQVSSGSFNSPTNEMIKLPAVSGIYIIYFNTELDKRSIVKVIVY